MPVDKSLYVSLVLGISLGNGFRRGVVSDLVTTAEDQVLMRDVISDALGYVKPGFTVDTSSLHAPEIEATDAQKHADTINALASSANKKLHTFSVAPAPAARPYKADLREMVQQEIALPKAYVIYEKVRDIGVERNAKRLIVTPPQLVSLVHFVSDFPCFGHDLQNRMLRHYEGLNSQSQQTWNAIYIFGEHFSTRAKANIYLDEEKNRKADEEKRQIQIARTKAEHLEGEAERAERKERFQSNGYPKVVRRFFIDLPTIYNATDMQAWMSSNNLSEENERMTAS